MNYDETSSRRSILSTLHKRHDLLMQQRAAKGISADPSVFMEIEDLKSQILDIENALEDANTYKISPLTIPLQKYDAVLEKIVKYLPSFETDIYKFRLDILECLKFALSANSVFIARDTGSNWITIASTSGGYETNTDIEDIKIHNLLSRSIKYYEMYKTNSSYNKSSNIMRAGISGNAEVTIVAPTSFSVPLEFLVIKDISLEFDLDTGLGTMLEALIGITNGFSIPKPSYSIQMSLLNSFKSKFVYVSDTMYRKQFDIFKERLSKIIMFYEPIISLSPYPYINRWEALARDPLTSKAPVDLFETAQLWGRAFQLELDMYCLSTAVRQYRLLPKRMNNAATSNDQTKRSNSYNKDSNTSTYQSRVGDVLPLSINVYPETLIRRSYKEAIINLAQERFLPLDKITLEISEKSALPIPEDMLPGQDEVSWYKDRLKQYTKLGITFAIDDYGIGFASASRLSRLDPAIVKIDRDALLHAQGSYTIQHVLKLEQDSMGKMKVIVEGFDDESKLSLAELYQMGIRYVQGHALGEPTPPKSLYRLSLEQENDILKKLGIV